MISHYYAIYGTLSAHIMKVTNPIPWSNLMVKLVGYQFVNVIDDFNEGTKWVKAEFRADFLFQI